MQIFLYSQTHFLEHNFWSPVSISTKSSKTFSSKCNFLQSAVKIQISEVFKAKPECTIQIQLDPTIQHARQRPLMLKTHSSNLLWISRFESNWVLFSVKLHHWEVFCFSIIKSERNVNFDFWPNIESFRDGYVWPGVFMSAKIFFSDWLFFVLNEAYSIFSKNLQLDSRYPL